MIKFFNYRIVTGSILFGDHTIGVSSRSCTYFTARLYTAMLPGSWLAYIVAIIFTLLE
ncbi:MAG: hypothetical protein WAU23_06130 [Ferruginibacter sp.]